LQPALKIPQKVTDDQHHRRKGAAFLMRLRGGQALKSARWAAATVLDRCLAPGGR
jgi:hypothetical protein